MTVFVTNHDRAFGSGEAFPAYLKATPPRPGAELRRRLAMRLGRREGDRRARHLVVGA
jgi:hypothetical protein